MIVLASQSASRRALLEAAKIEFEALSPGVDEEAAKEALRADGLDARALADALAELKALKVSRRVPGGLVLGCDQTLSLDDGSMIDKAVDRADAARILRLLSGRVHHLHSAAVIVLNGEPIWRHVERVRMTVRPLSDAFIDAYLESDWEECRWCVGCYRIEGPGAQLFSKVEGSQFAIQGLPLLPLLDFLRVRGVLAA
ncbi:MAG: Maf-like protein [Sphingobium sp.]|uniref:Nucleoside triphosphate pyrophosphatase n=1 Tax=Sphingobium xenophagum TaxID=121428 RepID=A0A249MRL0_SPHXE|nr:MULTISPECIES: nucleoside triphosphate pyrophosphatase [Sphingobium]MBU0659521.1 Maf family protein [Alphaproteobacteria bacterium]ASY43996.1 septum formation protein Maf [Sphingobium xenophagum]MBA4755710.1 Maf-like protein [Sphingobium sp.]MBG6118267.1 septum formation protein [Sphingobium sp. JAI105]MBS91070.1 septum formation protein Maf [Sphingobium sp.]|tara:strand:+ start:1365 stop:1958 length:594 start_codon:yes stop_codon:yes gene_type:complete